MEKETIASKLGTHCFNYLMKEGDKRMENRDIDYRAAQIEAHPKMFYKYTDESKKAWILSGDNKDLVLDQTDIKTDRSINIVFSNFEFALLKELANKQGISAAAFIHKAALAKMLEVQNEKELDSYKREVQLLKEQYNIALEHIAKAEKCKSELANPYLLSPFKVTIE